MADIILTEWQQQVSCFFKALLPGLLVQTSEEQRALEALIEVVQNLAMNKAGQRRFVRWSDCTYREFQLFTKAGTLENAGNGELEFSELDYVDFLGAVRGFAEYDDAVKKIHRPATLILADPGAALTAPTNVRGLREALNSIRGSRKTIILLGNDITLPREVANDISIVPFELPTFHELYAVINPTIKSYKKLYADEKKQVVIDETQVGPFCRACSGVSESEARALVSLTLAKHGGFDANAVQLALKEKERIVKRSNILECITPTKTLSSVGGLENVKQWLHENAIVLHEAERARQYGLKLPSGLLLLGIPGCGKSLTAKALAAEWRVPLLICDVGNLFASHVGESEARVREMIRIANAAKPCVVFIDELEKCFGGAGDQDGGTSSRVRATFLTWMQDKSDEVFLCATANNIRKLEGTPEMLRRFDAAFFVDLPGVEARKEILQIHLREAGHESSAATVLGTAQGTAGFSGAELATVVQKALRSAFNKSLRHPTAELLESAVKSVTPLSTTMKEQIAELRNWCRSGRAQPASTQTLEADELGLDEHVRGKPDLR